MTHMDNKIDNAVIGTEKVISDVKKAVVDEKSSTPAMDVTKDKAMMGNEKVDQATKNVVVDEKSNVPSIDVPKDNAVKVTEKVDSGAKKVGDSIKEHGAELKKDILGVGSKIKDTLTK